MQSSDRNGLSEESAIVRGHFWNKPPVFLIMFLLKRLKSKLDLTSQ